MTNLCAVTSDLSRHFDYQDKADEYQAALKSEIAELMLTNEFNPFDESNYLLALEESDLRPVVAYSRSGLYYEAGKLESQIVVAYWMILARRRAEEILDGSLG